MFKTGSKFLFGLSAFGFVAAFAYAGASGRHELGMDALMGPLTLGYKGYVGDHVGFAVLIGLSAAALFLGVFLSVLHEADPHAVAEVAGLDTVPEVPAPDSVNYWPVVAAFSAGALVLGLAIGPVMFVIGGIGLAVTTVEWAARAWSDRATGDAEVNRAIRGRLMHPVEIPATAVLAIGGVVLLTSRILLALPKAGYYAVFALVPVAILAVGSLIVLKPKLSQSVVAGLLLVGGVALLAGGVIATIAGEHHKADEEEEHGGKGEEGLAPLPAPQLTVIRVVR
jgi:hypothetical protein